MSSRFSELCLPPAERRTLLDGLAKRVGARTDARRAVVVFDLDATLLDNRARHIAILHELAQSWRQQQPVAAKKLQAVTKTDVAYEIADTLRRLDVSDETLLRDAEAFWLDRYFTDAYLRHDEAMPGAIGFVRRLHQAGANLVYLTGRDSHNMALGTLASLRDLGFPIGVVGSELVIKPDAALSDAVFKRGVAGELGRLGEVLASFDNEPVNCHALLDAHPTSASMLLATLHAPGGPAPRPEVKVIDCFET